MKIGRVYIGKNVNLGCGSIVLFNTRVEEGAVVGPSTLIMKGEQLPSHSSWIGSPARPWRSTGKAMSSFSQGSDKFSGKTRNSNDSSLPHTHARDKMDTTCSLTNGRSQIANQDDVC